MSSGLDHLRSLDHEQLDRLLSELQPAEWLPGERERAETELAAHDPQAPVEVLPPLPHAA